MTNKMQIKALRREISVLKGRLQPHDTGHIHTAISVLQHRVEELETLSDSGFLFSHVITDRKDYKLHMNVAENKSPKGLFSVDFVQKTFKDGKFMEASTYNYHIDMAGINNMIEGLNMIKEIEVEWDHYSDLPAPMAYDIALSKAKCHMEIDSPYNDGYTREFYRKELDRLNTMYEST
jgi:hypothetical protein